MPDGSQGLEYEHGVPCGKEGGGSARRTSGNTGGSAEGNGKADTVLSVPGGSQGLEDEHEVPCRKEVE